MASKRTRRDVSEQSDYEDRRPESTQQQLGGGGGAAPASDDGAIPTAAGSFDDMGLSDDEQAAVDSVDVDDSVSDREATAVKRSLGAAIAEGSLDSETAENVEITREETDSGEATTVTYTVETDAVGEERVASDQSFSFATEENPTAEQVDRATTRLSIASNGVDINDHAAGEQSRNAYHENGEPTYVSDAGERSQLHATVTNESMADEGWDDLTSAANESLDTIHESDGVETFTNTRENTGYEAVNGRETITQAREVMNDEDPGHAAELVAYHPELASETTKQFSAGDDQKKMLKWADDNLDGANVDSEAVADVELSVTDESTVKARFKQAKAQGANLEDGFIEENFRGPMGR